MVLAGAAVRLAVEVAAADEPGGLTQGRELPESVEASSLQQWRCAIRTRKP